MLTLPRMSSRFLIALLLVAVGSAYGQAPDAGPDVPVSPSIKRTDFDVSPARAPRRLLAWRIMPSPVDMGPGDAGPLYSKAVLLEAQRSKEGRDAAWRALKMPVEESADAQAIVAKDDVQQILRLVDEAAVRDRWTVEPPGRTDNMFDRLLIELSYYRSIGRLVALRARAEIVSGRYGEAIEGLRSGYVLSDRLSRGDTIMESLIGLAIRATLDAEVANIIRHEGSPNLYWALAGMPSGYEAMRRPIEREMNALLQLAPALKDPATELATTQQWQKVFTQLSRVFGSSEGDMKNAVAGNVWLVVLSAPATKHMMNTTGKTLEEVRAIPITVVVGMYMRDMISVPADEVVATMCLPYAQAAPRLQMLEEDIRTDVPNVVKALLQMLVPSVCGAVRSAACADRRTAALMCVEAIRMHAAETGELPERLEDITVVPVPRDPMTGKPFEYHMEAEGAILQQPGMPMMPGPLPGISYRITLRK